MATTRLNLTRDQLATFLKDHEQIRQFERLFADVNQLEPTTLVDLAITASTAGQQAVEALDALERIASALEMVTAAPVAPLDPTPALREIQADLAATQAQAQQALTLASELAPVVQGLQCLPPPREFKRVRYGQFYNTATQTQTSTNVAVPVDFNTTDISVGVRLRSPSTSEIEVDTEGIYNFQASMQFDSAGGSNHEVWVWFRKNGTDIPNSAMYLNIQNNQSEILQAFNLLVEMKALDYLEVMWEVGNINAEMAAFAATGVHPAVPSIILTVSNNIQGFL
jgi:hypothetical protein